MAPDHTDGRDDQLAQRVRSARDAPSDEFTPLADVAPDADAGTRRDWPSRDATYGSDRVELRYNPSVDDAIARATSGPASRLDDDTGWTPPAVMESYHDRTQFAEAVAALDAYSGFYESPEGTPEEFHPLDAVRAVRAAGRILRGVTTHPLVADDDATSRVVDAAATQTDEAAATLGDLARRRGFEPDVTDRA